MNSQIFENLLVGFGVEFLHGERSEKQTGIFEILAKTLFLFVLERHYKSGGASVGCQSSTNWLKHIWSTTSKYCQDN